MAAEARNRYGILSRITCPHCWERFSPEKTLWVSEHNDLLGDPRLGAEEPQRFLPTRFTARGEALDAKGIACHTLACPRCHLTIPRGLLESEPLFISILGAPASGKSFYLAAMTWELRHLLALQFAISFSDADPLFNRTLNSYEEALFVNSRPDRVMPLADLIQKTEEQGEHYDFVSFGGQTVSYPRPILFALHPEEGHPNCANAAKLARIVCLYDNAGEHFQPGRDTVSSPVTRHLAQSRALMFVFDPTQDGRVRQLGNLGNAGFGSIRDGKVGRQEPILQEAAARVRRYSGLRQTEKHKRPLIVVVTKYDLWSPLLDDDAPPEPWRRTTVKDDGNGRHGQTIAALDTSKVREMSAAVRELLLRLCPEIVAASESFSQDVTYVPVSAVGWAAHLDPKSGQHSIRPAETRPYWVTVPFLYALSKSSHGLVPVFKTNKSKPQGHT